MSFAATYPGFQQREGREDKRYGGFGERTEIVVCWDPGAESSPILQQSPGSDRPLPSKWQQPKGKQ